MQRKVTSRKGFRASGLYRLKRPCANGTEVLILEPCELLRRLAGPVRATALSPGPLPRRVRSGVRLAEPDRAAAPRRKRRASSCECLDAAARGYRGQSQPRSTMRPPASPGPSFSCASFATTCSSVRGL